MAFPMALVKDSKPLGCKKPKLRHSQTIIRPSGQIDLHPKFPEIDTLQSNLVVQNCLAFRDLATRCNALYEDFQVIQWGNEWCYLIRILYVETLKWIDQP